MCIEGDISKIAKAAFALTLFFFSDSLRPAPVTIGDVVRVRHVSSGKFLCSGDKSFNDGQFDGVEELDRRHKQVWLADESSFDCLWAVKAEHSDDLRWNSALASPVKGNKKVRLENMASHCNLSILRDAKHVVAMKRISRPMGTGAVEDEVRVEFVGTDGLPSKIDENGEVTDDLTLKLSFTDIADKELIILASDDGQVKAKPETEFSAEDKPLGVWDFDVVESGFAQKDNDSLKASMESFRARSEIEEIQGNLVSTVCLWQDSSATKFLICATNNYDFYSYISKYDNTRAVTRKLQERLACIDIVDENSIWSTDRFRQVRKAIVDDAIIKDWIEVDGPAEFVFSGRTDEAYRLSSVGWGLYKTSSVEPKIEWEDKPILDNVVSADVGVDGALWWIDLDGVVQKKQGEKVETVFEHTVPNFPKFVKVSAAGTFGKNYVALLRSDGQVFLSKNGEAFFNPGLNQVLDVSVAQAGRIAFIARRLNWVHGPIFKSNFKEFERWHRENYEEPEVEFESPGEFLDYFAYNFELVKQSDKKLSELIADFEASTDKIVSQLKKHIPSREFFTEKLMPASKAVKVGRVARQAMGRLERDLFGIKKESSGDGDAVDLAEKNADLQNKLNQIKSSLKNTSQDMEEEKTALENKVELMGQELEASLTKVDELEAENKDLKARLSELEGEKEQSEVEPEEG